MKKQFCFIVACLIAVTFCQCNSSGKSKEETEVRDVAPSVFNIDFTFFPPKDLDSNATPQQLVEFAWEEFFALNWKSSYSKNQLRDFPDTTWSFSSDANPFPDTLVWETYAHRSELRPYSDNMLPFDAAPHYSYGTPVAPYPKSNASFTLFNVLDENNEIGSCYMYAHTDRYNKRYEVLYQAKVNRDEYQYIYNHYPTSAALATARAYTQKMISQNSQYAQGVRNSCNCPDNYPGISLPCGSNKTGRTGAMEVKTAWRELSPEDDASKFLTRTVVYFQNDSAGTVYFGNKTYALIGLHIIHKTANNEDFIFATWEHNGVEQDAMGYQLISPLTARDTMALMKSYSRLHAVAAITDSSTSFVHRKLKSMNPNSIWLNYRLIGVQGTPAMDSVNTFNYFLANYVVESDPTLNDFHGSGIGKPHNGLANTLYRGTKLTMGGCQGCHGVAQMGSGTDFSFLLDNAGKPILKPDLQGDSVNKIQRLIRATQGPVKF